MKDTRQTGLRYLLSSSKFIEGNYKNDLLNILNQNQYDNIFHEHIGFHSLKSIDDLCMLNSLKIFDIDIFNSQGGSIRFYICKINSKKKVLRKVKTVPLR